SHRCTSEPWLLQSMCCREKRVRRGRPTNGVTIPPGSGRTETAATRGELSSPQPPIHPGEECAAGRTVPATVFTHPEVAAVGGSPTPEPNRRTLRPQRHTC